MTDEGSGFATLVYWYDLNRLLNATNHRRTKAIPEQLGHAPGLWIAPQESGAFNRFSLETRQLRLILHRVNPNFRAAVGPRRNRQKKTVEALTPFPK